ncbi:MAG: DUF2007 domain-containing protein [Ignavibacteriae bacterium]|nr:DUF2007 domain-containing protein [Ignavibacteriota bacterium]
MADETRESEYQCADCGNPVMQEDEFCPHCGSLFVDGVMCRRHPEQAARGVCIVCCTPFCGDCGKTSSNMFLCEEHQKYEIYEGMARVYGTNDEAGAHYIVECLKQQDIPAVAFSRVSSTLTFGGPDYTMFNAVGDYMGRIINEFKVMVPCQLVEKAESLLEEILTHPAAGVGSSIGDSTESREHDHTGGENPADVAPPR